MRLQLEGKLPDFRLLQLAHLPVFTCICFTNVVHPCLRITSPRDLSDADTDARRNERLHDDFMPLLIELS